MAWPRAGLAQATAKKVPHTWLPSVGFQSWSWFLAVSLQVTWVINPAVGCHYFLPGPQLPAQPLIGLLPVLLLGEQRNDRCMGVNSLPKTVTRQRCGCDLNPGPSVSESITLTTQCQATWREQNSTIIVELSSDVTCLIETPWIESQRRYLLAAELHSYVYSRLFSGCLHR